MSRHLGNCKPEHRLNHIADSDKGECNADGREHVAKGKGQCGADTGSRTIDTHGSTHFFTGEPHAQHFALQNLGGQEEGTGQEGNDEQRDVICCENTPDLTGSGQRQQNPRKHPDTFFIKHMAEPNAKERARKLAHGGNCG